MARSAAAELKVAWVAFLVLVGPSLVATQQLSSGPPPAAPAPAPPSVPVLPANPNDPSIAYVSSGLELAAALADPVKEWAVLKSSIQVNESDWNNWSSAPVPRTTNFTIYGTASNDTTIWPVLGLGFVKAKIRLENNTALILYHVVVRDFRATPLGQSPGFDIVASSTSDAGAVVIMQHAVLMLRICVPRNIQGEIMASIQRPSTIPGSQVASGNVSQNGCTNDANAPLVSRCWPDAGVYQDVAVAGFDIDAFGRATATRYALYMLNVPYYCEKQMQEECVSALGPLGCFLFMFPRTPISSPSNPTPSQEGQPSSANKVPAIVAGVVAGVVTVVVVAVVAFFVMRRRRQNRERKALYEESDKLSATSVNPAAGNGTGSSKHPPGGGSAPASLGGPPSTNAAKLVSGSLPDSSLQQQPSTGRNIILPSGVGTCVLSSTDVDASSPLVIVTPFTPHRSDLKLDVQCDTEVKLLPIIRGKGSYGRVVEGLYGGQRVAVKLVVDVDEWSGPTDSLVNSFAQEVEVLGRCQHPNIVRLLAACLKPPRLCLVMELMDTSLERLVHGKSGDLLPLPTVLHIAADIARGLAYLHPTIVHRDLKPGNVLLSNLDSMRPIAKLTDFGLSRLRSTVLVTRHPEAGTPAYMAPEAFDASNYVITHKADIYALGVILWEMLTGSVPWDGCSMVAIAYSITVRHHRLPLSKLDSSRCPPKLRKLIHQCWDPDPQRRPAAAELVKQLTLVLQLVQGDQEAPSSNGSLRSNANMSAENSRAGQHIVVAADGLGSAGAAAAAGGSAAGGVALAVAAGTPGNGSDAATLVNADAKQQQAAVAAAGPGGSGILVDRGLPPAVGLSSSGGAAVVVTQGSSSLAEAPGATSLSQVDANTGNQAQLLQDRPGVAAGATARHKEVTRQPAAPTASPTGSGDVMLHSPGLHDSIGTGGQLQGPALVSQSEL